MNKSISLRRLLGFAAIFCATYGVAISPPSSKNQDAPLATRFVRITKLKFAADGKSIGYRTITLNPANNQPIEETCELPLNRTTESSLYGAAQQLSPSKTVAVSDALAKLPGVTESWVPYPNGRALLAVCREPKQGSLFRVGNDGAPVRINLDNLSVQEADVSPDGSIVAVASGPTTPPEIYLASPDGQTVRKLTDLNGALSQHSVGASEGVSWPSVPNVETVVRIKHEFREPAFTPGFNPNGVLTYPSHYDPAKAYPLLVVPEPGPQSSAVFDYDPNRNFLADSGCLVLYVNCRGSDNLGRLFKADGAQDSGAGQAGDIEAGIDLLVRKGLVDRSHVLVFGWSHNKTTPKWVAPLQAKGFHAEYHRIEDTPNIYESAVQQMRLSSQ